MWLAAQRYDLFYRGMHIVGIDEKCGLFRKDVEEIAECYRFVLMCHDPRVSLRPKDLDAETKPGIGVGTSSTSSNKSSAGCENAGGDPMSTAGSKFDHGPSSCCGSKARSFTSDEGLEVDG